MNFSIVAEQRKLIGLPCLFFSQLWKCEPQNSWKRKPSAVNGKYVHAELDANVTFIYCEGHFSILCVSKGFTQATLIL
jgi:hypothetical protein